MKTIVIKFGGSSLADPDKIRRAAAAVLAVKCASRFPVAVVSAPADSTDDLLSLARLCGGDRTPPREADALMAAGEQVSAALLAAAAADLGGRAVSLTGRQAGIRTDSGFSSAAVLSVDTARLRREMRAGNIPVVAGFQGSDKRGDITTLGRGGSDLTAVVLAGALRAEVCEFRTDVKGIYTAHPAIVPEARRIARISYGEVLSLARLGTEVRQLRAVAYAARHSIPLHLRSAFHDEPGTLVTARGGGPGVSCLSLVKDGRRARIGLVGAGLGRVHAAAALEAAGPAARACSASGAEIIVSVPAASAEGTVRALHRLFFPGSRG